MDLVAASRACQIDTAFPEPFKARAAALRGARGDQSMSALGLANLLYWPSLSKE